ncbi:hypothetical protein [Butyrivibrio sp.]|uniref:hypothetical protein n=1 Tax=Butyrivibrio sp. TaxID=28121 RepID=UPI0025C45EC7|nr:hypothetical protein [Butyrivibrio sp.]MBQ7431172.1 hypothetical protein [Butyrivibrio sp.]MBQ9302508.1 hypothetical protein [Butyrivibrio sp.]
MSVFEMAAQVEKIPYDKAVILYGLGFSIQVESDAGNFKKTVLYDDNSIEQCSLEEQLIRSGFMDSDGNYFAPVTFYVDLGILNHAGLHLEYEDGRPNSIEYGTFDWLLQILIPMQKQMKMTSYVKNNTIFATVLKA